MEIVLLCCLLSFCLLHAKTQEISTSAHVIRGAISQIEGHSLGELFRRHRPEHPLSWTGERLVTDINGPIENEHLHRYLLAREFCRGKAVLDVASGEGYGTALLAQVAQRATGLEIDADSVCHAAHAYPAGNLCYLRGEASRLPFPADSFDTVVSFETLEHIPDQELFLAEIQRVLRPDGLLIISTPDTEIYSGPGTSVNPFHVRELTRAEFESLLQCSFSNVIISRQRAFSGSVIIPEPLESIAGEARIFEQRDADTFEAHREFSRAPFLIAIGANVNIPPPTGLSIFMQATHPMPGAEIESSRARLAMLEAALTTSEATLESLRAEFPTAQVEFERLQRVEVAVRDQAPLIEKQLAEAASRSDPNHEHDCFNSSTGN